MVRNKQTGLPIQYDGINSGSPPLLILQIAKHKRMDYGSYVSPECYEWDLRVPGCPLMHIGRTLFPKTFTNRQAAEVEGRAFVANLAQAFGGDTANVVEIYTEDPWAWQDDFWREHFIALERGDESAQRISRVWAGVTDDIGDFCENSSPPAPRPSPQVSFADNI